MATIAKTADNQLINGAIKFPQVRLIDAEGQMVGVVSLEDALKSAEEADLDLVCISPNPDNPVCRVMDYNKFLFEKGKKEKEAKKKQKTMEVKEIRLGIFTEFHDLETKATTAAKFLQNGDKVKINMRLRGREMGYVDKGKESMLKFGEMLSEYGNVEKNPILEGRNMSMTITPKSEKEKEKAAKAARLAAKAAEEAAKAAESESTQTQE